MNKLQKTYEHRAGKYINLPLPNSIVALQSLLKQYDYNLYDKLWHWLPSKLVLEVSQEYNNYMYYVYQCGMCCHQSWHYTDSRDQSVLTMLWRPAIRLLLEMTLHWLQGSVRIDNALTTSNKTAAGDDITLTPGISPYWQCSEDQQ